MHVDRQLPAVSKPSPLCMACSALAVRGVQRWPSVPHTWWGCAGACNAWRGTGIQCVERDGVPLGCCGVGVRRASSGQSSLERVERVRGLRSAPPNCRSCRSPRAGSATCTRRRKGLTYYLLASLGTRGTTRARMRRDAACGAAVCGAACTRRMYARHVRAACTRCMCARAGGVSRR